MLVDYRNPYCVGFVIIFSLLIAKEVKGQTEANDTGILTGKEAFQNRSKITNLLCG